MSADLPADVREALATARCPCGHHVDDHLDVGFCSHRECSCERDRLEAALAAGVVVPAEQIASAEQRGREYRQHMCDTQAKVIESMTAALARVEVLRDGWDSALDENRCPSCGMIPETYCDHGEGYHHALSDLLAALAAPAEEQPSSCGSCGEQLGSGPRAYTGSTAYCEGCAATVYGDIFAAPTDAGEGS